MSNSDNVILNNKTLEAKCMRQVLDNLGKVGSQIGQRTRMKQLIAEHGIVATIRSLTDKETSGWNDLYLAGLLGLSAEATVVESAEFRRLFVAARHHRRPCSKSRQISAQIN